MAIQSEEYQTRTDHLLINKCKELIQAICYARYAKAQSYSYIENVIKLAMENGPQLAYPPKLDKTTISDVLELDRQCLDKASPEMRKPKLALMAQKASGSVNVNFDPGRLNCPYVRSSWLFATGSGDHEIVYLRHGTPTVENGFLSALLGTATRTLMSEGYLNAETDPVYEAFLDAADVKGENVLYVSHQAYDPSIMGNENDRSLAIEPNQEKHRCFHFLALPMDGAISKGTSHTDAAGLKKYIVESLIGSKGGFRLPRAILEDMKREEKGDVTVEEQYAKHFAKILDDVQGLYFEGQELDTPELRQTFLMIAYHYLKMDMMQRYMIKYLLSACKDNIDRGNSSTTTDEAIWNVDLDRHNDPEALDLMRYQVAGPPYLVKKQGILAHRLILLTNVLNCIANLKDDQIEGIRKYHSERWMVRNTKVERKKGQEATPSLESAMTREEYEAFVRHVKALPSIPKENPNMIKDNLHVYWDGKGFKKEAIRNQVERDLNRTQIKLNGVQYFDFNSLFKDVMTLMKGDEEATWMYLILLQQGTNADVLIDLNKELTSEKVEIHATGKPVSKAQRAIFPLLDFCKEKHSEPFNVKLITRLYEIFSKMGLHPFDESFMKRLLEIDVSKLNVEGELERILIQLQNQEDCEEFLSYLCKICTSSKYRKAYHFTHIPNPFKAEIKPCSFHTTRVQGILGEGIRQIKTATDYVLKSTNPDDPDAIFGQIQGYAQFELTQNKAWTHWVFV